MSNLAEVGGERGAVGVPRIPATVFSRPRLTYRLHEWDDVTVLLGPIGSGKTTLLAEWAYTMTGPLLWCEPQERMLPLSEIEVLASTGRAVIIIDRGELVDADQFVSLGALLDRNPGLRVAIATRSARTAGIVAAATDASIDIIAADELLVTADDLRAAGQLEGDAACTRVVQETGGLIVAVRARIDDVLGRVSGVRERLRQRLVAEADDNPAMFQAAMQLALLPKVDQKVLTGWQIERSTLLALDEAGLTNWDGTWLTMNPFIRSVLAEEAAKRFTETDARHLIETAVRDSLIASDPVQALRSAFAIGDLELAADVAFENPVELLERRDESYEVFAEMPASRVRGYPSLIVLLVLLSNMDPDTRPRALHLLASESLHQRLRSHRISHRQRVVYRAFEAAVIRLTPFAKQGLGLIRRSVDEFLALSDEDMDALGRLGPLILVHLGVGAFYQQDFELARRSFDLAYAKHAEKGRADRVDPLSMRAGLAALRGDLPLARRLLDEADTAEWPDGWREASPAYFFHLGNALIALEDADADAARSHLDAAGPTGDIIEHWALYALVRARRDRLAGEGEVGLLRVQHLRAQRNRELTTPIAHNFIDAAEAELRLATGDFDGAVRAAARSAKHGHESGLVLARAYLALDRSEAAATQAARVLSQAGVTVRSRLEAELVLIAAALRGAHNDDVQAIAKRIVEIVHSTGMHAPLRIVSTRDRDALATALQRAGLDASHGASIAAEAAPVEIAGEAVVRLSPREQAVLAVLAETGMLDEIAERLYVSRNTVKSQLRSIYRKLDVSSRDEALTRAAVLGLLLPRTH